MNPDVRSRPLPVNLFILFPLHDQDGKNVSSFAECQKNFGGTDSKSDMRLKRGASEFAR